LQHLPKCLESLGQSAREAIDLRYRSQLRMAVIAEKLKRSEGAVKLLVHRARQALRHCLNRKLKKQP
jgi:RNA polymerase sigma-70 factor (ECF subfamily)